MARANLARDLAAPRARAARDPDRPASPARDPLARAARAAATAAAVTEAPTKAATTLLIPTVDPPAKLEREVDRVPESLARDHLTAALVDTEALMATVMEEAAVPLASLARALDPAITDMEAEVTPPKPQVRAARHQDQHTVPTMDTDMDTDTRPSEEIFESRTPLRGYNFLQFHINLAF